MNQDPELLMLGRKVTGFLESNGEWDRVDDFFSLFITAVSEENIEYFRNLFKEVIEIEENTIEKGTYHELF